MSEGLKYQQKGMPFRTLGASGLRVPVFSLGGCKSLPLYRFVRNCPDEEQGLTFGGTVHGDPVKVD